MIFDTQMFSEVSDSGIMYWTNNTCEFYVLAPRIEDESNKDFF